MTSVQQTAGTVHSPRLRQMFAVIAGIIVMALVAVAPATPALAGVFTAHVISGKGVSFVNVRQAATTSSSVLRTIPAGAAVGLNCYSSGQAVAGPYGSSSIWYSIDGGGYVSDAYLETNSNSAVTPSCSAPKPAPAPATSGRAWGQTRATNTGVSGNCTFGAYEKFKAYAGVYPALSGNARYWYSSARTTGWTTTLDAQINSIVVFQPGVKGAGSVGHVAWVDQTQARADGLYIHVIEMNGWVGDGGGLGKYNVRWVKDVAGMSYILAPHR